MTCVVENCSRPTLRRCALCEAQICGCHSEDCDCCGETFCPKCFRDHAQEDGTPAETAFSSLGNGKAQ